MRRALRASVVLLLLLLYGASLGHAQTGTVVGQTPDGRNVILTVIPLKFLDPAVAAQLFGGTVVGGNLLVTNSQRGTGFSGGAFGRNRGADSRQYGGGYSDYSSGSPFGYDGRGRGQSTTPYQAPPGY